MEIISWPIGVNRTILSETSIEVGAGAVKADTSENGSEMTQLTSSGAADTFSVTMRFSNSTEDSFYNNHVDANGDHITEWQAFLNWFKYVDMMGTLPFYFHKIDDPNDDKAERNCAYKIKSNGLPKGTPEGQYYKVTMTWQQYITEYITVIPEEVSVDSAYAVNGMIDLRFTDKPVTTPVKADFSESTSDYYKDPTDFVIKRIDYDGHKSCVLYFDTFTVPGVYSIDIDYKGSSIPAKLIITEDEDS